MGWPLATIRRSCRNGLIRTDKIFRCYRRNPCARVGDERGEDGRLRQGEAWGYRLQLPREVHLHRTRPPRPPGRGVHHRAASLPEDLRRAPRPPGLTLGTHSPRCAHPQVPDSPRVGEISHARRPPFRKNSTSSTKATTGPPYRTNDIRSSKTLLTRYVQRMLLENAICDAVRFFHLAALSLDAAMKVDFDMTLLVIASGLYRRLARHLHGYPECQARQVFGDFLDMAADLTVTESEVQVRVHRRAHLPIIGAAGLLNESLEVRGGTDCLYEWRSDFALKFRSATTNLLHGNSG